MLSRTAAFRPTEAGVAVGQFRPGNGLCPAPAAGRVNSAPAIEVTRKMVLTVLPPLSWPAAAYWATEASGLDTSWALARVPRGWAEELACQTQQQRERRQHRNQVGNGHQPVERVGDVPDQVQRSHGAQVDEHQPDQPVRDGGSGPPQIHDAGLAVVAPADDGGEGEQQ